MSIRAIRACDGSGNGVDVPNPSTGTLFMEGETNLYEWGCETTASDPWIEVDYTRTTHDKLGGLIFRTQAGISCKIGAHKDNEAAVRELGHCGECAWSSMQLVRIPLGTGLTGITQIGGGTYGLIFIFRQHRHQVLLHQVHRRLWIQSQIRGTLSSPNVYQKRQKLAIVLIGRLETITERCRIGIQVW